MTGSHFMQPRRAFRDPCSPAKNEMPNQETNTSGQGTTHPAWAGSCRLITMKLMTILSLYATQL
jgi:hypothetical protein